MSKRIEQVNELIRQEVGKILLKEVPIPKDCLVTITRVKTSPDLRNSSIMLSVFPPESKDDVMDILKRNAGKVQSVLHSALYMRPLPRIRFRIDKIEERAERIESLIDSVEEELGEE